MLYVCYLLWNYLMCILLYMIMCMLLSASTHFKWELMLYCLHRPTLNKVFLLLLLLLLCEMRHSYITAILPHAWWYSNLSHRWNFTHIFKPYTATILNIGQVMASYVLVRRAGAFIISLSWLIFSYVFRLLVFFLWRQTSNAGTVISHHPIRYLS